uniref:uncharacterized protein LOC117611396 n=1 Tax=Osmia lignaria TaxID=473952 RepID=UPI0014794CD2|nr:uncharacterized protein LOC117611396 [Osmia lignaria]
MVLSEPYITPENWFTDLSGRASICVTNLGIAKSRKLTVLSCGMGFVGIKYNDIGLVSVYASPNDSNEEFKAQLAAMEIFLVSIRKTLTKILVLGDFNAKSPLWGSKKWCGRGRTLFQWCNSLGLIPVISKGGVTCERGGGSVIDLLFCSNDAMKQHTSSEILDTFTASDHKYIIHKFGENAINGEPAKDPFDLGKGKIDEEGLLCELVQKYGDANYDRRGKTGTTMEVDKFIDDVEKLVNKYTTYRGPYRGNRHPVYWWNEDTARYRKDVNKARRRLTRLRAKGNKKDIEEAHKDFKMAKKAMNREVKKGKRTRWENMLSEIDKDIWGRPYKLVTRKLKGKVNKPDILSPEEVEEVVKKLFILSPPKGEIPERKNEQEVRENIYDVEHLPDKPGSPGVPENKNKNKNNNDVNVSTIDARYLPEEPRDIPEREREYDGTNMYEERMYVPTCIRHRRVGGITPEEIIAVVRGMPVNKAPGPDRLSSAVTKKFSMKASRWLAHIYNTCYAKGY